MTTLIAFSQITGTPMGRDSTVEGAIAKATLDGRDGSPDFIEVLDCGNNAEKVWTLMVPLHKARASHPTVFRGTGYDAP